MLFRRENITKEMQGEERIGRPLVSAQDASEGKTPKQTVATGHAGIGISRMTVNPTRDWNNWPRDLSRYCHRQAHSQKGRSRRNWNPEYSRRILNLGLTEIVVRKNMTYGRPDGRRAGTFNCNAYLCAILSRRVTSSNVQEFVAIPWFMCSTSARIYLCV